MDCAPIGVPQLIYSCLLMRVSTQFNLAYARGCEMIIGIAHSKPLFALGLRACLDGTPDMTVVTVDTRASGASEAIDILLLESELAGDRPSLDHLREAARRSPVLVLVPDDLDAGDRTGFLDAGAAGCIDYLAQPGDIVDQVRAVSAPDGAPSPK